MTRINRLLRRTVRNFKQQNLPSVRFRLTMPKLSILLLASSLICIFLGSLVTYNNNQVSEFVFDYMNCHDDIRKLNCDKFRQNQRENKSSCICYITFKLNYTIKKNVFIYYVLGNYNQNHRLYTRSVDDNQLKGSSGNPSKDCEPFRFSKNGTAFAPCGIAANSFFNDSITLERKANQTFFQVPLISTGIAWPHDKRKVSNENWKNETHPPYWTKNVWELDPSNSQNNGYENEDLIVWLQISATQYTKKFYRRVDHTEIEFEEGLESGEYRFKIEYNYPVASFGSYKQIILTNSSIMGTKSLFLQIILFVMSGVLLICAPIIYSIFMKSNN